MKDLFFGERDILIVVLTMSEHLQIFSYLCLRKLKSNLEGAELLRQSLERRVA